MVACEGPHVTPWMNVQGGESRVRILYLGEGESITVKDEVSEQTYTEPGEFPFSPVGKFCVRKDRSDEVRPFPTMVEVLYG